MLCVLGLVVFRWCNNETNSSYSIKSDPNRQDAIALEYCAIYVCYNKLKCSDLFYTSIWTIYQLQQKRYPTNSAQQQKYSILAKSDTLFWTHLVFVLCNSYVLKQTEVYRSLLYIYWDNISTPTSVMSLWFVHHYATQSQTNHRMPHLCTFEACDCVTYRWYTKL